MTSEQVDDRRFVAGFILNKLYSQRRFARRRTGKHRGHIRLTSLHTGLPPGHLDVEHIAREMNGKLVMIFKNEGEDQICAYIDKEAVEVGLPICNYYLAHVKMPLLDKTFKELIEQAPVEEEKEEHHKLTDKDKRNKEYLEQVKKWMKDEGLSSQT